MAPPVRGNSLLSVGSDFSISVRQSAAQHVVIAPARLLEVIVTSVDEALEAQEGGADRLELVRELHLGGLSPSIDVVESVVSTVSIPVRVMLRHNSSMHVQGGAELAELEDAASAFAKIPINGVVAGFVAKEEVDLQSMDRVARACRHPITFHRAFEELKDPERQVEVLSRIAAVDRILVRVGETFTLPVLSRFQSLAGNRIQFITGVGLNSILLEQVRDHPNLREIHAGRAVREPAATDGKISRAKITALKKVLL